MNFNAVAQYMDDVMRGKHSVACCDIIIRREHEQLYRYMCGNCDHEGKVPVSEKTLYYFYSCTKPVTVAAGMRLVEEGKLRLDAPVSDYLPEFAEVFLEKDGKRVPPKKAITVWNLFTMSAGLDYNYYNNEELKCAVEASNGQATTREIVRTFALRPLRFEPGEAFLYSLCHDVLAAVIETVAGMRFSEYLDQIIFTPLEMTQSTFHDRADTQERLCAQYRAEQDGSVRPIGKVNNLRFTEHYESGGAGLISCTSDYAKFADAMACEGIGANGYRLLKPETVKMIYQNQLPLIQKPETFDCAQGEGYGYGLGVRTRIAQKPNERIPIGEFGWDGATGTYVMIDTAHHLSVSFAMQMINWPYVIKDDHLQLVNRIYDILDL